MVALPYKIVFLQILHVRNSVKENGVWLAGRRCNAMRSGPQLDMRSERISQIAHRRNIVECAVGIAVRGVDAREITEIIEGIVHAAERRFLMIGSEITGIDGVLQQRLRCGSACRCQRHHARGCIGAVQRAVRTAIDFRLADAVRCQVGKIHRRRQYR